MKPKLLIYKLLLILEKPLTAFSASWLKFVRKRKISDEIMMRKGIYPFVDHYYEPLINPKKYLKKSLCDDRSLPGIDFNVNGQLELLHSLNYQEELQLIHLNSDKNNRLKFDGNNNFFESLDAEFLYCIVRYFKPDKIIEVGSGSSTLMILNAIEKNKTEDENYSTKHICIEPYENNWLESLSIEILREKVENINISMFEQLGKNDILFIDSSHIIRPQGDVLFEYLEILPILKPGVLIHIHDIFSPKDYPEKLIFSHIQWNEQYLLEAFLTYNKEFEIIGSLNFLSHKFKDVLIDKFPAFAKDPSFEPGSFWIKKTGGE